MEKFMNKISNLFLIATLLLKINNTYSVTPAESKLIAAVNLFNLDYVKKVLEANPDLSANIRLGTSWDDVYLITRLINVTISTARNAKNEKTCINIAELLINRGANLNKCQVGDLCALPYAIKYKLNGLAKYFVTKEAQINTADTESPLYIAIDKNNFEIVKFLIDNGADINTCLRVALNRDNFQVAAFLLDIGADVTKSDLSYTVTPEMQTFMDNFNKYGRILTR